MSTVTGNQQAAAPRLENGDRITRDEFERRYYSLPEGTKVELIEGVVYMASPARHRDHARPTSLLNAWLAVYMADTPGTDAGDNGTVRLDMDNEPQPDGYLRIEEEFGGQSSIGEDGYLEGPPELVAEIAASSASYDLHDKLRVYRRNGVKEYVVWRVLDEQLDWFILRGGVYDRLLPDADGLLKSETFSGLWLDLAALLRGELAVVLRRLGEGIAHESHAAFVAQLSRARQ